MRTRKINNIALEGKIKLAVKFSDLKQVMNAADEELINADKAVKKLLKSVGIDCIECDLWCAADGSHVKWYRKERKGQWYDWSEKERKNNGQK